jgi:crotonobetainyl-CoA:carnitine CoA-transferase CaiB-like acyl-CoA transferase
MYAALAVLGALYQRKVTGRGQELDISLFDCMLDWVAGPAYTYLYKGVKPARAGMRHAMIVPYGPFRAKDGQFVNLAVEHSAEWKRFCLQVLDRPDLLEHPLYATNEKRLAHRSQLEPMLESIFATQDTKFWVARLEHAEVPFGRMNELEAVLDHPQLHHRKLMAEVQSPVGLLKTVASPVRMAASPPRLDPIPTVGQHTAEVLAELGYSKQEITRLRETHVV